MILQPTSFRKARRAWRLYKDFGWRGLTYRISRRLLEKVGFDDPKHVEWLRRKSEQDAEFDRMFGTDTGGVQDIIDQTALSSNANHAQSHIATEPAYFRAMIDDLQLPISRYTFVDLGSGKGRALILAANYPFAKVVGVEFVPAFVESARINILAAAESAFLRSKIELVLGDAATFEFPNGPVLLYLFNPFGSQMVRKVAENAYKSWQSERRPFTVIYMNPVHLDSFTSSGWQVTSRGAGWVQLECRE